MSAAPVYVLFAGLLTVAILLLMEHGYLELRRLPDGLGWSAQMVNGKHTWGLRVQWEAYPAPWRGKPWRYERAATWMAWPRCLRLRAKNLSVLMYLGGVGA